MEWNTDCVSHGDIEHLHQIPELHLDDVERILLASDQFLTAVKDDKEDNQTQTTDSFNEFRFATSQEASLSDNSDTSYSNIKLEDLNVPPQNEEVNTQSHLKHGVLNIN